MAPKPKPHQCQALAAPIDVVAHQGATRVLAERIEADQSASGICSPVPRAVDEPPLHEIGGGVFGAAPQPGTLIAEPVLKDRVAHADAVQQVAAVERKRGLQGLWCPIGDQALEFHDVHRDGARLKARRQPVAPEGPTVTRAKHGAEPRQRVLQAVARVPLVAVAPQKSRESLAGVRFTGRERQDSQKRPVLLSRQFARRAVYSNPEAAKECNRDGRHVVLPGSCPAIATPIIARFPAPANADFTRRPCENPDGSRGNHRSSVRQVSADLAEGVRKMGTEPTRRSNLQGTAHGDVPDWAALMPAGVVALGAPTQPVERLMGTQAAVYRLISALGRLRLPRSSPSRTRSHEAETTLP